jgi:hypothetical protein
MKNWQAAQRLALKDLIGVPHHLQFSKGARFESREQREHQSHDPSKNRNGSVTENLFPNPE